MLYEGFDQISRGRPYEFQLPNGRFTVEAMELGSSGKVSIVARDSIPIGYVDIGPPNNHQLVIIGERDSLPSYAFSAGDLLYRDHQKNFDVDEHMGFWVEKERRNSGVGWVLYGAAVEYARTHIPEGIEPENNEPFFLAHQSITPFHKKFFGLRDSPESEDVEHVFCDSGHHSNYLVFPSFRTPSELPSES